MSFWGMECHSTNVSSVATKRDAREIIHIHLSSSPFSSSFSSSFVQHLFDILRSFHIFTSWIPHSPHRSFVYLSTDLLPWTTASSLSPSPLSLPSSLVPRPSPCLIYLGSARCQTKGLPPLIHVKPPPPSSPVLDLSAGDNRHQYKTNYIIKQQQQQQTDDDNVRLIAVCSRARFRCSVPCRELQPWH
jgi:hypothetical protein